MDRRVALLPRSLAGLAAAPRGSLPVEQRDRWAAPDGLVYSAEPVGR